MGVEITIDTAVVVRNPGEILVRTKLPEPFTKAISVAQKKSGENEENRRIQAALAESGIDKERVKTSLREGILDTVCPGSRKRRNTVYVRNATMRFILNAMQPLQKAPEAPGVMEMFGSWVW